MVPMRWQKEPGYLMDLVYAFVTYYNPRCRPMVRDAEAYDRMRMQVFSTFCDELLLFFYLKEEDSCFFYSYLFRRYQNSPADLFGLSQLCDDIQREEELRRELFFYYFPETTPEQASLCLSSLTDLSFLVKMSSYPDPIRHRLLSFFINPNPYAQVLVRELMSKEAKLRRYAAGRQKLLRSLSHCTTPEGLMRDLYAAGLKEADARRPLVVSALLFHDAFFSRSFFPDHTLVLLGSGYEPGLGASPEPTSGKKIRNNLNGLRRLMFSGILRRP